MSKILGKHTQSSTSFVSYTPTFNGVGTVTNINIQSRRVFDCLEVTGYFQIGTPTASLMQMTLGFNGTNGNVTVNSSKIGNNVVLGMASPGESSATYFSLNPISPSSSVNYVQFGRQSSTGNMAVAINGNALAAGVYISVNFMVPITGWSSSDLLKVSDGTKV